MRADEGLDQVEADGDREGNGFKRNLGGRIYRNWDWIG